MLKTFDINRFPYDVNESDVVVNITLAGEPLSKQRARFGRNGNVYTPIKTRNYEDAVRWTLRGVLGDVEPDAKSKFALRCLFYRSTRQRIDCDNLIKAISDAANGQVWEDDAQVMEIFGRLFLANDNPRVEILIHKIDDPAPRGTCPVCGGEVTTYPSQNTVHCSIECASKAKRQTLNCKECGKEFDIPQSLARLRAGFCCRQCSMNYYGRKRTEAGGPLTWKCQDCGGPVSRKEYIRCRACSMIHRQDPSSNYWRSCHETK